MPINISTVKMGVHFLSRKFHHLVCPSLTAFKSVVLISLLAINNFSHVFRLFLAAHCRGLTPHGLTCAARPTRPDLRGPTEIQRVSTEITSPQLSRLKLVLKSLSCSVPHRGHRHCLPVLTPCASTSNCRLRRSLNLEKPISND